MIHKTNAIYTNDNRNVTQHSELVNITSINYYTKKIERTNDTTNNITKHNHNNYEHNAIKTVNKHITHINKYGNEINHYKKRLINL